MGRKLLLITLVVFMISLGGQTTWADNDLGLSNAPPISKESEDEASVTQNNSNMPETKSSDEKNVFETEDLPNQDFNQHKKEHPSAQSNSEMQLQGVRTELSNNGANVKIIPQYTTNMESSEIHFTYLVYDLQKQIWIELCRDTTDSSCMWNPTSAGVYWIHVVADIGDGIEYAYTMGYTVQGATVESFFMDKASSQPWNTAITLTGTVSNPLNEKLTYEYLAYDGSYWKSLSKSEKLDSYLLTAEKPGNYLICFQVYDTQGKVIGQKFLGYEAQELYVNLSNLRATQSPKGGIDLNVDAKSNDSDVEYKWVYYNLGKKQWGLIKDWSVDRAGLWSPTEAGAYWIQVEARTCTGQKTSLLICYNVHDIRIDAFTSDVQSPRTIGSSITISGHVDNSLNQTLHYRYIIYDGKSWTELYSSDTLQPYVWNPKNIGDYLLALEVTASNGKVYQSFMGFHIDAISTKIDKLQVYTPDFKTYYIMQNVKSNDPNLTYTYQIYNLRSKQWITLPTGGNNTYWQPTESGSYWIHAIVTGSDGSTYTNTIAYWIQGYRINSFGFSNRLEAGKMAQLKMNGNGYLNENLTYTYLQWNGSGWNQLYQSSSPGVVDWQPGSVGYYAFCCQITNQYGTVVDTKTIHIAPSDFTKNGWYYENGYKFYYINNVKQLDLDGILPQQSTYIAKVNRTTCTVTIYAQDGSNGYIIPVKRFACSVGLPSTPTPTGTYRTSAKYRWHELMGPSYGQYCTRIVGGILFHSVAGANTTSFNLNPAEYNRLGSPASHGCVRLCVKDAKWIYDNCKIGMQVTIYDSSNPGPLGQGQVYRITNPRQNWDPTDPNV